MPSPMVQRPVSLFLYGSSLPVVNLTLYAFAHSANPGFLWIDVRARNEPSDVPDPALLGWISKGRVVTYEAPEAVKPNERVTAATVSRLIADEESPRNLSRLIAFLQLPDPSQCVLAAKPANGRPGIVAVPNVHRVLAAFANAPVEPIIDAHLQAGYSLFVGYSDHVDGHHRPVGPGRNLFDYVFRVIGDGVPGWRNSRLVCEKGEPEGPFRTGSEFNLAELPFVADVFHRATVEPRPKMPRP